MEIVGIADTDGDGREVHTIDVWFSQRRQVWCIERLDADGHQIGLSHRCMDKHEALACLGEWSRTHAKAQFYAPLPSTEVTEAGRARRAA